MGGAKGRGQKTLKRPLPGKKKGKDKRKKTWVAVRLKARERGWGVSGT